MDQNNELFVLVTMASETVPKVVGIFTDRQAAQSEIPDLVWNPSGGANGDTWAATGKADRRYFVLPAKLHGIAGSNLQQTTGAIGAGSARAPTS